MMTLNQINKAIDNLSPKAVWTVVAAGLAVAIGGVMIDTTAEFKIAEPIVSQLPADQRDRVLSGAFPVSATRNCETVGASAEATKACHAVREAVEADHHQGNWFQRDARHIRVAL
jgi:hypothetical protein